VPDGGGGEGRHVLEIPFSAQSKRAIELATMEAGGLAHGSIGTEHLLLGLLGVDTSIASRTLIAHGLTLTDVRSAIRGIVAESPPADAAPVATELRAKIDELNTRGAATPDDDRNS